MVAEVRERPLDILICEDEALFAAELEQRVKTLGHRTVGITSSAEEALNVINDAFPDVVIMDVNLDGEMSGVEAANILYQRYNLPCLFLTAATDERTISEARASQPLGYLMKPVQDRDLKMALDFGFRQHQLHLSLKNEVQEYRRFFQDIGYCEPGQTTPIGSIPEFQNRMKSLSSMIGGLAHHLNNSLAVVYGHLDWLMNCGTIGDFELRSLNSAISGCERQRLIVQQLLWASQNASHFYKIQDLGLLVSDAITKVSPYLSTGIEISFDKPTDTRRVFVDAESATAALVSIIINALEAISGTGTICVSISQAQYEELPELRNRKGTPGWFYFVDVNDTGSGFPTDNVAQLLEPFYTTKDSRNALGLGLSAAYGIMQSIGGWLSFRGTGKEGTTVRLAFPLANQAVSLPNESKNKMIGEQEDDPGLTL